MARIPASWGEDPILTGGIAASLSADGETPLPFRIPCLTSPRLSLAELMHLSPDHKSLLAEILTCRTPLEARQAETGAVLCHSSVFVAVPNHHMFVLSEGIIEISSPAAEKVHFARPSTVPLFASVASLYKRDAIAVVLTGGDGDGSIGVSIIKANGGTVIARDFTTSQDFSMPQTAIETGDVDFILPLEEIASKLTELVGVGEVVHAS
jgi:two-component system chemotaxis response regulator CheB